MHLGIAVRAGEGLRKPRDAEATEQARKRAKWLDARMKERRMSVADINGEGGPDRKTIQKVLNGEPVGAHVIEKIAKALGVPREEVP
jgi:lambda repressor-like predicted transcriptional regulator